MNRGIAEVREKMKRIEISFLYEGWLFYCVSFQHWGYLYLHLHFNHNLFPVSFSFYLGAVPKGLLTIFQAVSCEFVFKAEETLSGRQIRCEGYQYVKK